MDSNDTMPFNSGLLPEKGPNAREKHWKAQLEQDRSHPVFSVMNTVFRDAMVKMGANPNGMRFASAMGRLSDIHCQLTVPEFELPRNDLRENLIYIGVPKTVGVPDRSMPEWWDKIVQARRQGKKVVAVTRSSADPSLEGTIVPGIEALKNRDDLIVVVSLVNAEIDQLKLAYPVPDNVYVAKFIPMDLFLPYVRNPSKMSPLPPPA